MDDEFREKLYKVLPHDTGMIIAYDDYGDKYKVVIQPKKKQEPDNIRAAIKIAKTKASTIYFIFPKSKYGYVKYSLEKGKEMYVLNNNKKYYYLDEADFYRCLAELKPHNPSLERKEYNVK